MYKIAIFLGCLCFYNMGACAQNKEVSGATDSTQKLFVHHFKILDKAAKKSKVDTIYCCRSSVNFMERYTQIEPGTMGNFLGRLGFTKVALKQWHEWYDKKYKARNN
jgi:hypothetical protein